MGAAWEPLKLFAYILFWEGKYMSHKKPCESIHHALAELYRERERLGHAITNLEVFLHSHKVARSHPTYTLAKSRSRKGWTEDARAEASARMKAYWAQRRGQSEAAKASHAQS